ncbi:hypothetical protein, partial [Kitasatospora sp. NPDC059571]|uniref:hypothetical protein n=1 Tax=Kitasatospora sp. NPDC059571 TaxID=3346871 RepID=UPI0036774645
SGPPRSLRPPGPGGSAAVTVVTLAAVVGIVALRTAGPKTTGCPQTGAAGAFHGTTYNANTVVRAGANLGAPIVMQAPPGCALQFTGYCLGDVVVDITSGTPDLRWFKVRGGGVVSSGVVHGNPPAGMAPSDCQDSVPAPTAVALSVARPPDIPDSVELRAGGRQVAIVGFAAYFATPDGSGKGPGWQQIGLSSKAGTAFAVPWRFGPLRTSQADARVPVVAVACLGGGAPTDVLDAQSVPLDPAVADAPSAVTLSPGDRVKAERAACKYPQIG